MLNQFALRKIEEILDSTELTSSSFHIEAIDPKGNKNPMLTIKFKGDNKYLFEIRETGEVENSYRQCEFHMRPSAFREVDFMRGHLGLLNHALIEWVESVQKAITLDNPIYANFSKFKEEINKKIDEHIQDEQSHFTDDEREQFISRLKDMETKFDDLKQRQEITEQELKQVKDFVATYTGNINALPKKTWFRAVATKIYGLERIFSNSKTGQGILEQAAQRLLEPPKPQAEKTVNAE